MDPSLPEALATTGANDLVKHALAHERPKLSTSPFSLKVNIHEIA